MARLISVAKAWANYQELLVQEGTTAEQLEQQRLAFMTGAALLFALIMSAMDPGEDPTADDLAVMGRIADELQYFGQELDRAKAAEFMARILVHGHG